MLHYLLKITSILSSEAFTFYIGPNKAKRTVQASLFKGVSEPLHAMMNGHMSEATAKEATLEDVDVDAFTAFCAYGYIRDYTEVIKRLEAQAGCGAVQSFTGAGDTTPPSTAPPRSYRPPQPPPLSSAVTGP